MAYDLYPAVDPTYNFPPEIRLALSKSAELRNTVVPMTTTARNNLSGVELWDGRVIANTTTDHLERYDLGTARWWPIANSVETFATPAARDAAIPAPSEGMKCYITSLHQEQIYATSPLLTANQLGWIPCGGSMPSAWLLWPESIGTCPQGNGPLTGPVPPNSMVLSGGLTWDSVTGMFTAPYSGWYQFNMTASFLIASGENFAEAAVGSPTANIWYGSTAYPVVGSIDSTVSASLPFDKGEQFGPWYGCNIACECAWVSVSVNYLSGTHV